ARDIVADAERLLLDRRLLVSAVVKRPDDAFEAVAAHVDDAHRARLAGVANLKGRTADREGRHERDNDEKGSGEPRRHSRHRASRRAVYACRVAHRLPASPAEPLGCSTLTG